MHSVICNERPLLLMLIHGQNRRGKRARLYCIWSDILTRCYNPNRPCYKDYGGRGILVQQSWKDSFEVFRSDVIREIGEPPSAKAIFGRIDVNLGYQTGNIRWASRTDQNRNRRPVLMSMEKANEVRAVYDTATSRKSGITAGAMAEEMDVTVHVIYDIARGKTWKPKRKEAYLARLCGSTPST
jgi:hypothetical protein